MKPRVIVIRAQGKPLFVWCAGDLFVAAFTWDRLVKKASNGAFKRVTSTTLAKRLPVIG